MCSFHLEGETPNKHLKTRSIFNTREKIE